MLEQSLDGIFGNLSVDIKAIYFVRNDVSEVEGKTVG